MKLLLVIIVLVGLAIWGAQQVSHFADPGLHCTHLIEQIKKSVDRVREVEQKLRGVSDKDGAKAQLLRTQLSLMYLDHLKTAKKFHEVSSSSEAKRKAECNARDFEIITYNEAQLKALGIEASEN